MKLNCPEIDWEIGRTMIVRCTKVVPKVLEREMETFYRFPKPPTSRMLPPSAIEAPKEKRKGESLGYSRPPGYLHQVKNTVQFMGCERVSERVWVSVVHVRVSASVRVCESESESE